MGLKKSLILTAILLAVTTTIQFTFAGSDALITQCPPGEKLKFHQLANKYVGYWYSTASNGSAIESENMTIPNQIYNNGYSIQFSNEITGQGFVNCLYYLQDNVSGVKTPFFKVSSAIHH